MSEQAGVLAWQRARDATKRNSPQEAAAHFAEAGRYLTKNPNFWAEYGQFAAAVSDFRAARLLWERAAALVPDKPVMAQYATLLLKAGKPAEARDVVIPLVAAFPGQAGPALLLSSALDYLGDPAGAADVLEAAVIRMPGSTSLWMALASQYIECLEPEKADSAVRRAALAAPGRHELYYVFAEHHLRARNWADGFDLYEYRRGTRFCPPKHEVVGVRPRWDGKPTSQQVCIRAEQGVGDEIMFSALFADLERVQPGALVTCDPRLIVPFSRAFPRLSFVSSKGPEPMADVWDMEGDLGRYFRRSVADFDSHASPWLTVCADRVAAIRAKYLEGAAPGTRLVGISWRSKNPRSGAGRSLSLAEASRLLQPDGIRYVSLQYEATPEEIAAFKQHSARDVILDPGIDAFSDIDGLMHQVAALDDVVTTSNSTVHVAGALGVPCTVLLPRGASVAWIYGYPGSPNHWYPRMRSLRMSRPGDWTDVIDKAVEHLRSSGNVALRRTG